MGKREIRLLATPKPLNRSSQKVAHDIYLDIYRHAKFSHDPLRGFFSPYARNCASKCLLYSASFFRVLPPLNRFSRVIRQMTRFRARIHPCLPGQNLFCYTYADARSVCGSYNFVKTRSSGCSADADKPARRL